MNILYTGLEWENLCHGGEYEVVRHHTVSGKYFGVIVLDENGEEDFLSPSVFEVVVK